MFSFKHKLTGKAIIGDPVNFSLEERIFNTVCIIAFIAMCIEVPFNYYIGLMVPTYLCAFGVVFSVFLYYLSKIKRKSKLGIFLFCAVCNICFAINHFFNSGLVGPNLLLFALVALMVVAIIPKSQFKVWVPINLVLVWIIIYINYRYPQLAPNVYSSEESKVLDFALTYTATIIIMHFTISYIRKNYEYEKNLALVNNLAVEEQNAKIRLQKEELERLNSEKDKLFSIVSHDIRTPINSIQNYLEVITDEDLDQNERLFFKQQLLQLTKDTSDMLMNVLSWSKAQMKGAHTQLMPLDITELLLNGMSIEKTVAQNKGVNFKIEVENKLCITADQNMFLLVVRNLVNNAIKFTKKGGEVKINAFSRDGRGVIEIIDTGLGITEDQQEKLFKLKASSTYGTNNEKGIGLGLLLCKEFTELQNGLIWFESEVDKGSVFCLSFELCKD